MLCKIIDVLINVIKISSFLDTKHNFFRGLSLNYPRKGLGPDWRLERLIQVTYAIDLFGLVPNMGIFKVLTPNGILGGGVRTGGELDLLKWSVVIVLIKILDCSRDRYNTHLYCLAVQAGFYSDAVECWSFVRRVAGSILSQGKR